MPISVSSNYDYGIMSNNLQQEKREEIVTCYHSISNCNDACNVERVSAWGLK